MWLKRMRQFCLVGIAASLLLLMEPVTASLVKDHFPLPPRILANGYVSSDYMVAHTDLMLPVLADKAHSVYLNPSINYGSDKQGYLDLGLGYRCARNFWTGSKFGSIPAILGVYLFAGYSRINNNARLWVINPGVEALASRWDAHANAYIPMGDRNFHVSTLNNPPVPVPSDITFSGHSEFVATLVPQQIISQHAGDGADVELAYQLFSRIPLKGYLGAYFFAPAQVNPIWGSATGLEYWVNSNVKTFFSYTYDNLRHSTGALGVGIELGGTHVHRSDPSVEERITDPVHRYLAKLGQGSGMPARQGYQNVFMQGAPQLLFNNIAFFSQTGGPNDGGLGLTIANCTYENPCGPTDLTNAGAMTLAALLPNTMMYFNGGTYAALNVPGGSNRVTLQLGQSVSSRTPDYTQLATGTGRSTFSGAFLLDNNDALNNVIVLPVPSLVGPTTIGVRVDNLANFSITGSQIGSAENPYTNGISDSPFYNGQGVINNSQIFASSTGIIYGGPLLFIQNSMVNVTGASIIGVIVDNGFGSASFVNLVNSQINVIGASSSVGISSVAVPTTSATAVANNTTVRSIVLNSNGTATALSAIGSGSSLIQFNQGALSLTGSAGATINTRYTVGIGTITISPSTICMINGSPVSC